MQQDQVEMMFVGRSGVPRWLWDMLEGRFEAEVLSWYFRHRGLHVYYEGAGAGPAFLEEHVSVEVWVQAITAWSASWTGCGQQVRHVEAVGPVNGALAEALNAGLRADASAVRLDVDVPGPAVFAVAVWNMDWWDPMLGVEVSMPFLDGPSIERLREAMSVARSLGARALVAGLVEATGDPEGAPLRFGVEGLVVEDLAGEVWPRVAAVMGAAPDAGAHGAPFRAPEACGPEVVSWSWLSGWAGER